MEPSDEERAEIEEMLTANESALMCPVCGAKEQISNIWIIGLVRPTDKTRIRAVQLCCANCDSYRTIPV